MSVKICEYGGMSLKTDHFKLAVLLKTLFKCHMQLESVVLSAYLLCLNDYLWLQNDSSILPLQVQYTGLHKL